MTEEQKDAIRHTTADYLVALRRELIEGGFEPREAFEIAMTFARELADEGFSVREGRLAA